MNELLTVRKKPFFAMTSRKHVLPTTIVLKRGPQDPDTSPGPGQFLDFMLVVSWVENPAVVCPDFRPG